MRAGTIWKAIGNRHGKDEGDPLDVMKNMPKPIHALSVYPMANMTPCMETMKPRDSGVETSAWYIGIAVTSAPIPRPLMIRPARNMPELFEPAQMAAPRIRIAAATWMVLLRENLSAQYAEHAAPIAEPAELTPETDRQPRYHVDKTCTHH